MFVLTSENFKEARVTIFLISINIIIFISFNFAIEPYYLLLAQINNRVINHYELWRLITAMFLHGDILHIFSNMFGLLLFGAFLETYFTKISYLLLYFISGLIGNIFSLILLPLDTISLGASGCVFGLIGAAIIIIAMHNDKNLLFLGIIYVLLFIISSFSPGTNYFAHIFGLLGGILFGYLLRKKKQVKEFQY
ncbi:MAG: rhomboid family intramembrane serine protease [Promethearchaeota archaeon]|jgi:rhomboid protease GluP